MAGRLGAYRGPPGRDEVRPVFVKGTSKNGDGIVYLNVIKPMFRLLPFIALFSRKVLQKCPALYEECFNP
jgi:hypothetical protein